MFFRCEIRILEIPLANKDKSEKLCGPSRLVAKNWVGARFSGFCTIWAIYPRRADDMRLTSAVKWPKRRSGLLCMQYC
jgi:hypothetical protein